MSYDVNIPAAVPRTLIRTPQLNPILAMFRGSVAGTFLKSTAAGVMMWDEISGSDVSSGTVSGDVRVDVELVQPPNDGAWTLATAGSGSGAADSATWESVRDSLLYLKDTKQNEDVGCALAIDVIEDVDAAVVARTGIHVKNWTRPDRGESSAILGISTGGGSCFTTYKSHRMRPASKPNLAYSAQGALECATDDMSFAAMFQSHVGFNTAAGNPDPTLTSAIDAVTTTIPLTATTLLPTPGSAVPYVSGGSMSTWPTPLYLQLESELISYTGGGAGAAISGVVRGVNSTAATHASGTAARFLCASSAVWIRMSSPVSKGIAVFPSDGVSFDTRPAFSIGIPISGAAVDSSVQLIMRMNGAIETVGSISTSSVLNAANASIVTTLQTAHVLGGGSTPAIVAGTGAGTGPSLALTGSDTGGQIAVTTGTTPAANAVICTVTFAQPFAAAPRAVILTPASTAAKALSGAGQVWCDLAADRTASSFAIRSGSTALAASTSYQFYFAIVG